MPTIPGLDGVNWAAMGGVVGQVAYYMGIGLICFLILMVFIIIYYMLSFDIKATTVPIYGSGKDGVFSVGKVKKNKIKWIQHRTAWRSLFPLFNKFEREPFDSEYIYPGKQVYVFELNNQWIPGRINIDKTENEIRAEVNPVPYYIRNWQSLQHKKNAIEFAKPGFWEQNKAAIMTVTTVLFCAIMLLGTVYMTYKYTTAGRADAQMLRAALDNFVNNAGGNAPR